MRFNPEFLEEIRNRLPISKIVGQRVKFDPKKSNSSRGDFWACCPFHGEKTPSFHCDDGRGRYHCFGCGASGDHFTFITELDGIGFAEAVERLAAEAGLQLPQIDQQTREREKYRKSLLEIAEMAAVFFQQALSNEKAGKARQYLRDREISVQSQKEFRIGYAPPGKTTLIDFLLARGVTLTQLSQCGLVASSESAKPPYDRFRNRIMFPITDLKGRVVAFGGRSLEDDIRAKYLNSPTSELFQKGQMLYHAYEARRACQPLNRGELQPIIVVEGYIDVLALNQAGIKTAVAPLGTALTEEQIELLWRISPKTVLCFDGDSAGIRAAYRAMDRIMPLLKAEIDIRFALLPNGRDPDDVIRQNGVDGMRQVLSQAKPLSELLWLKEIEGRSFNTPEERAGLEKRLRQSVFAIKDESLRHYYFQDIRERLSLLFSSRNAQTYKKWPNAHSRFQSGSTKRQHAVLTELTTDNALHQPTIPLRDAAILVTLLNHPQLWDEDFERLARMEFDDADLMRLYHAMLDVMAEWRPDDRQAMRELVLKKIPLNVVDQVEATVKKAGMRSAYPDAPFEDAKTALNQALYLHLRAHNLNKRLKDIEEKLIETPDEEIFANLRDLKRELEQAEDTQAIIEGFGAWEIGDSEA